MVTRCVLDLSLALHSSDDCESKEKLLKLVEKIEKT